MSSVKNILILGGTGPTGIITVRTALDRGHNVTVYARTPEKLPQDISKHPSLTIIKGGLSDTALLYASLPQTYVIISILGPNKLSHKAPFFSTFYSGLLAHLKTMPDPPRLVALSTISATDPNDAFSFARWLVVMAVWLLAKGAYLDILGVADVFRKEGQELDWVLFRVAVLQGGKGKGGQAGYVGKDGWSIKMDMADIANWALKEAEIDQGKSVWNRKMPAIW